MEPGYLVVEVNASEQFTLNLTSASLYCPITIVVRKFGLQPGVDYVSQLRAPWDPWAVDLGVLWWPEYYLCFIVGKYILWAHQSLEEFLPTWFINEHKKMIIRNVNLTKVSSSVRNFGWSQFPEPEDLFFVYKIPPVRRELTSRLKTLPGSFEESRIPSRNNGNWWSQIGLSYGIPEAYMTLLSARFSRKDPLNRQYSVRHEFV